MSTSSAAKAANAGAKSARPRKKVKSGNAGLKAHLKKIRVETARERALRIARADLASTTPEEDAAITAAAEADPDAIPMTDDELARARPGRPPATAAGAKQAVSVRLDPDVVEALKADGAGWQTRMNAMLREALKLDAA